MASLIYSFLVTVRGEKPLHHPQGQLEVPGSALSCALQLSFWAGEELGAWFVVLGFFKWGKKKKAVHAKEGGRALPRSVPWFGVGR